MFQPLKIGCTVLMPEPGPPAIAEGWQLREASEFQHLSLLFLLSCNIKKSDTVELTLNAPTHGADTAPHRCVGELRGCLGPVFLRRGISW